ncbi:MAG: hypothetical protein VKK62_11695 [Synechococcaceae cyanobacterium]|nr:hypothetical protein [Synechococcaceae cyanobacterium]
MIEALMPAKQRLQRSCPRVVGRMMDRMIPGQSEPAEWPELVAVGFTAIGVWFVHCAGQQD